jgi:holo-[acyl-carrier protein] synthase
MSIVGVGTDIVSVDRFTISAESQRLLSRVFTAAEREYCLAQVLPAQHFAARFAAKEATIKAVCSILPGLLVTQVEVHKAEGSRSPQVRLISGPMLPDNILLHISISHSETSATAFAVAEDIGLKE